MKNVYTTSNLLQKWDLAAFFAFYFHKQYIDINQFIHLQATFARKANFFLLLLYMKVETLLHYFSTIPLNGWI